MSEIGKEMRFIDADLVTCQLLEFQLQTFYWLDQAQKLQEKEIIHPLPCQMSLKDTVYE